MGIIRHKRNPPFGDFVFPSKPAFSFGGLRFANPPYETLAFFPQGKFLGPQSFFIF